MKSAIGIRNHLLGWILLQAFYPSWIASAETVEEAFQKILPQLQGGDARDRQCVLSKPGERRPPPLLCPFMKRSPPPRGQKENWGLDSTGADLIRNHPLVMASDAKGSYLSHQVAVIDSGLSASGNPAAGSKLAKSSTGRDPIKHGTHVSGTIASEKFGVNPKLSLKVFPVSDRKASGGISDEALLNQLDAAINDPQIKVINLSLSSPADNSTFSLIQEAARKGKWLVYAAGNEGKSASPETRNLREVQTRSDLQAVFSIGATTSVGGPASYSNFGDFVDYYAPGFSIESLNGAFNPNFSDTSESVKMYGTSMAAPHFSAVLATLSAAAPQLSVHQARKILNLTAIERGKNPVIRQVNAYGALELLRNALDCTKGKADTLDACIDKSHRESIVQCQKPTRSPSRPSGCAEAKKQYDQLRRQYFTCQGRGPSQTELVSYLDAIADEFALERLYYSDPNSYPEALHRQKTLRGKLGPEVVKEFDAASKFVEGKFQTLSSKEVSRERFRSDPSDALNQLTLNSETMDLFFEVCQSALSGGADVFSCGDKCTQKCGELLITAAPSLTARIVKQVIQRGGMASFSVVKAAENLESLSKEDLQKVYGLFLKSVPANPEDGLAEAVINRLDALSPENRRYLLEKTKGSPKLGWFAKAWLLDREDLQPGSPPDKEVRRNLPVSARDMAYLGIRTRAGQLRISEFGAELDRLTRGSVDGHDERWASSKALIEVVKTTPEAKNEVLRLLTNPGGLAKFQANLDLPQLLIEVSKGLDETQSKQLYQSLVEFFGDPKPRPNQFYLQVVRGHSRDWQSVGDLHSFLTLLAQNNPHMKSYLGDLLASKQSVQVLQEAREQALKKANRNAASINDGVKSLLAESPDGFGGAVFRIPPKLVARDAGLRKRFSDLVAQEGSSVHFHGLRLWLEEASAQDYAVLGKLVVPHLARLASEATSANSLKDDLDPFVTRMIETSGTDPATVRALFQQAEIIGKDPKTAPAALLMIQNAYRAKVGKEAFLQVPNLMNLMRNWLSSAVDKKKAEELRFNWNYPIPEPLLPVISKKIESLDFNQKDPQSWVWSSLHYSSDCVDRFFQVIPKLDAEYQVIATDALGKRLAEHLQWATPERVQKLSRFNPGAAENVRIALEENKR